MEVVEGQPLAGLVVVLLVEDLLVVLDDRQRPLHLMKVATSGMPQLDGSLLEVTLQLAVSMAFGLAMALPI